MTSHRSRPMATRYGPPPIVEGWGAYWIDDLECHFCGRSWSDIGGYSDGPDPRQYITINIEPKRGSEMDPDGIHLCPECADELSCGIEELLDEDVPMGMRPEDTDTMCGLPNDFYLWRSREYIEGLWWDEETGKLRDRSGKKVPGRHDEYSVAKAQRQAPSGNIRKDRR